jgi:hypothetical protein
LLHLLIRNEGKTNASKLLLIPEISSDFVTQDRKT